MRAERQPWNADAADLRRCLNDLVGVLALPAVWSGSEPSGIIQTLLDTVFRTLSLDVAYARMTERTGRTLVETVRSTPALSAGPEDLRDAILQTLGGDTRVW